MSDKAYKISLNLTTGAFEAEGDREAAREDYRAFLEAAKFLAQAKAAPAAGSSTGGGLSGTGSGAPFQAGVEAAVLSRAFLTRDGVITLAALPQGENALQEAILALLFGFAKVSNQMTVTALALAKALRLSGKDPDRIDRDLKDVLGSIVTKSGAGRGTRYGLTNAGMKRAEDIVRGLHE